LAMHVQREEGREEARMGTKGALRLRNVIGKGGNSVNSCRLRERWMSEGGRGGSDLIPLVMLISRKVREGGKEVKGTERGSMQVTVKLRKWGRGRETTLGIASIALQPSDGSISIWRETREVGKAP
jgi:hypothetical protein